MHVDAVRSDFGYVAIYLDGALEIWDDGDPLDLLVEAAAGRGGFDSLEVRSFGSYANNALCFEDPPDRLEDVPAAWWTDNVYIGEDEE